jgi:hypothetical protein
MLIDTAECAMCQTEQPCMTNGDLSICADRNACEGRLASALDEPYARVNWSEGPVLSPVEALRLALERGVFGLASTVATLRAALEAADRDALIRAEQLAAAREQAAINLEMRKIEAMVFDLPF